jgi:hypothetical protein
MDNQKTNQTRTENQTGSQPEEQQSSNRIFIILGIVGLLILVAAGVAVWALVQPTTDTARIRDIFISFMALESLLLGLVLIILIVQIARLTNLLQNEIKPILESTNETVSTLRGTTNFLSDNLVQPVIKLNEYVAALSQFVAILKLGRKRQRDTTR